MEKNLSFPMDDVRRVRVKLTWAQLEIVETTGAQMQVFVAGDDDSVEELRIERQEEGVRIAQPQIGYAKEILPRRRWLQVCVRLPSQWRGEIDVDTVAGLVSAHGFNGSDVTVSSVSGAVNVQDGQARTIALHAVSGTVSGTSLKADRCSLRTVSGDIRLDGGSFRDIKLFTVTGDTTLILDDGCRTLDSQSVSGSVCVETMSLVKASLHSLSGQFLLEDDMLAKEDAKDVPVLDISASSVSGDLAVKRRKEHA